MISVRYRFVSDVMWIWPAKTESFCRLFQVINLQYILHLAIIKKIRYSFVRNYYTVYGIHKDRNVSRLRLPWLSIRDAVFTLSPNKQYLGIDMPTTPATHGPVKLRERILFCVFTGTSTRFFRIFAPSPIRLYCSLWCKFVGHAKCES